LPARLVDSVAAVVVVLEADVAVVAVPLVTCVVVVVVVWVEVHQAVVSAVASAVLPNSTEEVSISHSLLRFIHLT
jgi:hypothetical protein